MNTKYICLTALIVFIVAGRNCPNTQVPNSHKVCITPQYIEGCLSYESKQTCLQCELFYELKKDGFCHLKESQEGECCSQKLGDRCVSCNKGLTLNKEGKCESKKIIGCLQKNKDGKCKNCASGFALIDGQCQTGITNCEKYQDEKTRDFCMKCVSGYSLVNNLCLQSLILGCEFEENDVCGKCAAPFHKVKDHCEIKDCASYNEYGCVACECGFYLTNEGKCKELASGCIRYQRGVCSDCQPHFTLKNSKCQIIGCRQMEGVECKVCKNEFERTEEGGCKVKNCLNQINGRCQKCEDRYRNMKGTCVSIASLIRPAIHRGIRVVPN